MTNAYGSLGVIIQGGDCTDGHCSPDVTVGCKLRWDGDCGSGYCSLEGSSRLWSAGDRGGGCGDTGSGGICEDGDCCSGVLNIIISPDSRPDSEA